MNSVSQIPKKREKYFVRSKKIASSSPLFRIKQNGLVSLAEIRMTLFSGRPPDFIAFVITILMMLLMAAGVKKSLVFNNVLNAINLAVWVFVMAAGMFYVDSNNWSEHKGFLPYGWSGVSIRQMCTCTV